MENFRNCKIYHSAKVGENTYYQFRSDDGYSLYFRENEEGNIRQISEDDYYKSLITGENYIEILRRNTKKVLKKVFIGALIGGLAYLTYKQINTPTESIAKVRKLSK